MDAEPRKDRSDTQVVQVLLPQRYIEVVLVKQPVVVAVGVMGAEQALNGIGRAGCMFHEEHNGNDRPDDDYATDEPFQHKAGNIIHGELRDTAIDLRLAPGTLG